MSKATGKNSIAIGDAIASGEGAIAIGGGTNITGSGPIVIGNNNQINPTNTTTFDQDYRQFCKEISTVIAKQAKRGVSVNTGSALDVRSGMISDFIQDMKIKHGLSQEECFEHTIKLIKQYANPSRYDRYGC